MASGPGGKPKWLDRPQGRSQVAFRPGATDVRGSAAAAVGYSAQVELQQIVERYAEAITNVDSTTVGSHFNARTGAFYLPGFKSLNEEPAVDAIDAAWEALHPGERQVHLMSVRYPGLSATAKCDHIITTDGLNVGEQDEWGIEVKRLQFVGDNGKRNDYATTKVLSPPRS